MVLYKEIGLGGTFDRLHSGHHLFLDIAAHYGQIIHIGLISEIYLEKKSKKFGLIIQNYEKRKTEVEKYLLNRGRLTRFSKIDTPEMDRILASKSDLEALIVSQETILGAMAINYLRSQKNKTRLTILLVPSVIRKNGTIESSTKLRKEEWSH